jgi:hypothetical protein
MIPRNIGAYINPVVVLVAQSSVVAVVKGSGLDRFALPPTRGAKGQIVTGGIPMSAVLHGIAGAVTGAPSAVGVSYQIQDSVDNVDGDYANSANPDGTNMVLSLAAVSIDGRIDVDLTGLKRWMRVVATITATGGTTPALLFSADLIFGGVNENPQNFI